MAKKSSTPDEPDLAILLVAANRVLVDRLMAAMDRAGLTMRPSWGYVIRALHAEPLPLARLAERLDVTKQAAQQMVDDMAAAGLVERRADPARRAAQAARAHRRRAPRAGDGARRERRAGGRGRRAPRARPARRAARPRRAPRRRRGASARRPRPRADRPRPPRASGSGAAGLAAAARSPLGRISHAHSAAETSARTPAVEQDRVQALEERLAPGEEHRLAAADPAEDAEGDEVGELARAVGARGASSPRAPRRRAERVAPAR